MANSRKCKHAWFVAHFGHGQPVFVECAKCGQTQLARLTKVEP